MKKQHGLFLLLVLAGAGIWALVVAVSGRREAWDAGEYFTIGIPASCTLSLVGGYVEPTRTWRWGIAPFLGQCIWMFVSQGVGNLFPLGIIMFGVFSIPGMLAAKFGGFVATRMKK